MELLLGKREGFLGVGVAAARSQGINQGAHHVSLLFSISFVFRLWTLCVHYYVFDLEASPGN